MAKKAEKTKIESKSGLVTSRNFRPALVKRAWLTEQSARLANLGKYVFVVEKEANKSEVKKAVETIYKVKVEKINILNQKPKKRRLGASVGRLPGTKKAVVTLASGQKIDIIPV